MNRQWRLALLIVFVSILAVFAASVFAQTALTGQYDCKGENPDGSGQYTGQVTIESDNNGAYKFKWALGGQSYSGVGIQNGNAISVAYSGGGKDFGIVVYNIRDGGNTLSGDWLFYPGGTGLGKETLSRK
jgi:hypothetical protein